MRIAAVRFINTIPLIYGLQRNSDVKLVFDTPAGCHEKLVTGEVDVGLIPVIGTQLQPDIRAVRGLGIAAADRTESIYLYARKPLEQIQTILTDISSLTSVLLLRIIFKIRYDSAPELHPGSVRDIEKQLQNYDGVLVIGDQAIRSRDLNASRLDLATGWHELTGLPFVFAVWGCNRELSVEEISFLYESYEASRGHEEEIYAQAQKILPVDVEFLKRYYNRNLHYRLTASDYQGLERFFSLAAEFRFIETMRRDIWIS